MKRILSYSSVIISLGLTASTALAQTTANGPYSRNTVVGPDAAIDHPVYRAVEHG